jgi:hypothetical protein
MTALADTDFKNRTRWHWIVTTLLASLLLMAATLYSTAKLESTPVGTNIFIAQNLAASGSATDHSALASGDQSQPPVTADSAFAPFLDIVPRELFIKAGGVGELGGTVYANIGIGPGHEKGGWTMPYSDTAQAHVTTAMGFTPSMDDYGPISITTTLGLDSGTADFYRAHISPPPITEPSIFVEDLELSLVNTDTLATEAYIAAVRSYAPPGPPPLGHSVVGSAYSVRASGALTATNKPMSLHLAYNEITLAGAAPHTLAIFAWDAYGKRWDNLGRGLFYDEQYLSVVTSRFTTYALMATNTWRDDFDLNLNGLAEESNVTWDLLWGNFTLVLSNTPGSGSAVSKPITPTTDFANWGSLTFTSTADPPTTTLTVDVLRLDGSEVLTDVASGTDLADLVDPEYPSLRLRVNMSSTVAGKTPALDAWQLAWQVEEHKVYLPVILK